DADDVLVLLPQIVVCAGADTPHADDEDLGAAERDRLVVGMALLALETLEPRARDTKQIMRERIERRRRDERQRDGERRDDDPLRAEQAVLDAQRDDDQSELAIGHEAHGGQKARACAQPETDQEQEENRALDRQQRDEQQRAGQRAPGRRSAEADAQEEPDEKQLLESPEHVRELLRALVIGEHRAEQQRAELGAQAERLERLAAANRERGAEQDEQLAVSAAAE